MSYADEGGIPGAQQLQLGVCEAGQTPILSAHLVPKDGTVVRGCLAARSQTYGEPGAELFCSGRKKPLADTGSPGPFSLHLRSPVLMAV